MLPELLLQVMLPVLLLELLLELLPVLLLEPPLLVILQVLLPQVMLLELLLVMPQVLLLVMLLELPQQMAMALPLTAMVPVPALVYSRLKLLLTTLKTALTQSKAHTSFQTLLLLFVVLNHIMM
ncbi:MAG: hypothetical protein HQK88_12470 [Nitrospirae bacterium]|nr:hypothetical protein [Nitrospirota bacterium]MBF0535427.1 hypothetical protein [Nitrospirota bacterium]MBF0617615.1 hypothetical protein [Nitrospirota bacterium]